MITRIFIEHDEKSNIIGVKKLDICMLMEKNGEEEHKG